MQVAAGGLTRAAERDPGVARRRPQVGLPPAGRGLTAAGLIDEPRRARASWDYGARMTADAKDVETVERVIPAPPEKIFELLADPKRHTDIDGSGSVKDPKGETERLKLGSKFGMHMKIGVPYSMESTVIEFEEGRKIAWQTPSARLRAPLRWRPDLALRARARRRRHAGSRELGHLAGGRRLEVARRARRRAQEDPRVDDQDARAHRGARQGVTP